MIRQQRKSKHKGPKRLVKDGPLRGKNKKDVSNDNDEDDDTESKCRAPTRPFGSVTQSGASSMSLDAISIVGDLFLCPIELDGQSMSESSTTIPKNPKSVSTPSQSSHPSVVPLFIDHLLEVLHEESIGSLTEASDPSARLSCRTAVNTSLWSLVAPPSDGSNLVENESKQCNIFSINVNRCKH